MRKLFLLAAIAAPSLAFAQDTVELSDYQLDANDAGVKALIAEDYTGALANFQSSLRLGESNITLLNLGRTYQKMGKCKEAKDAYARAANAPAVASPTREEIALVLSNYGKELPEFCPTQVVVTCQGPTEILVNGQPARCAVPVDIKPGKVTVEATHASPVHVDVIEGDTAQITISHAMADAPITQPPGMSTVKVIGLTTAGIGAAALAGALVLDLTWVKGKVDDAEAGKIPTSEAEDAQFTNTVILGSGAGLLVGGALLYFLSGDDAPHALWVAPTPNGAALGGRF